MRAYLELGHATLFSYVHQALGYSEAQAFERIQAMRLAFRAPEVREALRAGVLTMTSIARLATHARCENLAPAAVVALSLEIAHKSVREVERVLAARATIPVAPYSRLVAVNAKEYRLEITVDEECAALLREAQKLDANSGVEMAIVVKRALKMYVEKKRQRKYGQPGSPSHKMPNQSLVTSGARNTGHAHIPISIRRAVYAQAQNRCESRSLVTGERCKETSALELDHRFPRALGGGVLGNLQILCASHNRGKNMCVGVVAEPGWQAPKKTGELNSRFHFRKI